MDAVYRSESRRVLATLIRLVGDFDLAEEAMQEAFAAAVRQWPGDGVPANPRAWLVSAGRFKAIDTIRRRARFDASVESLKRELEVKERSGDPDLFPGHEAGNGNGSGVEDDRLRLIFFCCHPCLPPTRRLP